MLKYFGGLWQPIIIKHMKCMLYTNIRVFNFAVRRPHQNILTMNISQSTVYIVYVIDVYTCSNDFSCRFEEERLWEVAFEATLKLF